MLVGVTGEIGAGKTTLAKIFQDWGAEVISGDEIGRELLEPEEPTYRLLLEKYGRDIRDSEGKIDRRKLGRIVFSSSERREEFNAIVHPPLLRRLREKIEEARRRSLFVVVDAALIVEWRIAGEFDKLIVVLADEKERIRRIKECSQLSGEELKDRFSSQFPREAKIPHADWVVENNGDIRDLRRQAEGIWRELSRLRGMHS
jgi:dephospho-CoA kinase